MPSTLMYFSKSTDAKPFKGKGENLDSKDDIKDYADLAAIPNWRKILSAFYKPKEPIVYNDKKFASREHAYHAAKFPDFPEFQRLFEVDSDSLFATNPTLAKAAGGKSGKVRVDKKVVYSRPSRVTACPERLRSLNDLMEEVMLAEFSQDELAKKVLLATRNAVLTHFPGRGGGKVVVERGLMRVRDELCKKK